MAQFKKGKDPNRSMKGRPRGSPNRRTLTADAIAKYNQANPGSDAVADILATLIDAAKQGCTTSSKIVLDRVEPGFKPVSVPVNLGSLPGDLFQKGDRILELCAAGDISSDVAKELLSSITMLLKVKEVSELERRLQDLESCNTRENSEESHDA